MRAPPDRPPRAVADPRGFIPYLTSGLILWGYLTSSIVEGGNAFTNAEGYIKQISLPIYVYVFRSFVTIGLNANELSALGGNDAGAVAKALKDKGTLAVWQYATRKAANGDLEQAPRAKIGLMAQDSLRVEPYASPLKVLPHE